MRPRPVVMMYCQHSLGIGHLVRSLAIAEALAARMRVVFLSGGAFPAGLTRPPEVEFVDLPALAMDADDKSLASPLGESLADIQACRRRLVLDTFARVTPAALLIELFPFGRKKFAFELLPLLRLARRRTPRPLVLCSVRDILVDQRRDQARHDRRAAWLVNRYFDAVLVHGERSFHRFEATFRPTLPLRCPLLYTGFVARPRCACADPTPTADILVSAGGGKVGAALLAAALSAHAGRTALHALSMNVIAGPFMAAREVAALRAAAGERVRVYRALPNLDNQLAGTRLSLSQCGYNTMVDVLRADVPALFVPYAEANESEQTVRAARLEQLGLATCLAQAALGAERLGTAMEAALAAPRRRHALNLDGAARTAAIVERALSRRAGLQAGGPVRA
ncbi:MAG: glycosyltransferase [Gammaproteobacteria bacterium]